MEIIAAISAMIPLITKVFDLFNKTPEEKREAVLRKLIDLTQDLAVAVDHVKKTNGDTKPLEDLLNGR